MRMISLAIAALALATAPVLAQQTPAVDPARVEAVVKSGWPNAPAEWQARLTPDATMAQCSATHNNPPKAAGDAIKAREQATIQYPPDGKLMGDWKKGQSLAQNGYGGRFTDYPPGRENGGNCYACHQLARKEIVYGTLGPSLLGYGKARGADQAAQRQAYERIYNPQAFTACSAMPRFGHNGVLTPEQIAHLVALLLDPDSEVNR